MPSGTASWAVSERNTRRKQWMMFFELGIFCGKIHWYTNPFQIQYLILFPMENAFWINAISNFNFSLNLASFLSVFEKFCYTVFLNFIKNWILQICSNSEDKRLWRNHWYLWFRQINYAHIPSTFESALFNQSVTAITVHQHQHHYFYFCAPNDVREKYAYWIGWRVSSSAAEKKVGEGWERG